VQLPPAPHTGAAGRTARARAVTPICNTHRSAKMTVASRAKWLRYHHSCTRRGSNFSLGHSCSEEPNKSGHMDRDVLHRMTKIVVLAKATPGAELELRLGRVIDGKFTVGCAPEVFREILNKLESNRGIPRTGWQKTKSCSYPDNVRVIHETSESSESSESTRPRPRPMKKRSITHLLIHASSNVAFKLALSSELPCNSPDASSPMLHVRLRDRQQFFHGTDNRRTWAYDFTRTQSASSYELARHEDPNHEIELELIDTQYLKENSAERVANSMLYRMKDLIGSVDQSARSNCDTHFDQPQPDAPCTYIDMNQNCGIPTATLISPDDIERHTAAHVQTEATILSVAPTQDTTPTEDEECPATTVEGAQDSLPANFLIDTKSGRRGAHARDDAPHSRRGPVSDKKPRSKRNVTEAQAQEPAPRATETKKRHRKSPSGAPKRPATSFMLFMTHNRASIKESLTEQGVAANLLETSRRGSEIWRSMSDTDKIPYIEQAKELHTAWGVKKAAYKEVDHAEATAHSSKKTKVVRDPDAPRRPPSSFVIFMNRHRATIKASLASTSAAATVTDIGRRGGELWSQLKPEERTEYTDIFTELNAKYKTELAAYTATKAVDGK